MFIIYIYMYNICLCICTTYVYTYNPFTYRYMYVYTHMYIYMYIYVFYKYICIMCVYTYNPFTYRYMYVYTHMYIYMYIYVYTYVNIYMCGGGRVDVCMCIYMQTCTNVLTPAMGSRLCGVGKVISPCSLYSGSKGGYSAGSSELRMRSRSVISSTCIWACMGWLRLVGPLKLQVSFAKEPYERDNFLQKRPVILRSLLIVATP